jgi:hypothetical protein
MNKKTCGNCIHLLTTIKVKGFGLECRFKTYKYKDREIVNYQTGDDLQRTCDKFNPVKEST